MSKKLPRTERRAQLLAVASTIVREEGTDALTLGSLAERAGVSKPIAYDHFETRSGLMMALSQQAMDRQVTALAAALANTPREPERIARVLAQAYLECVTTIGPEWHAVEAALRGDATMEAHQRRTHEEHAAFYAEAIQPVSDLGPAVVRRRCVGLVGTMETLSNEVAAGRMPLDVAVDDLVTLILGWLVAYP